MKLPIAIIIAMTLLSGCGRNDAPDIKGPYSKMEAGALVQAIADMTGGGYAFPVKDSGSMGMVISDHEIFLTVKDWDRIAINQLVAYRRDGKPVLHRVTHQDGDHYKTSGDTNRRSDAGWLTRENYIGTYIGRILHQ